jgi:hypothetical protein
VLVPLLPGSIDRRVASSEALAGALLCLSRLVFAIARRRRRGQRRNQTLGRRGYFVHGAIERLFVRARWTIRAAQLPDELKGGRPDFIVSRRRRKIG